jgi:FAD/FMN-containing dehydrogenase
MLLGYSFLSNQYGLTVDNVAGYELVLPNGTVINVTSNVDDLWFGLRVSSRQAQYSLVSLRVSDHREVSIILYATVHRKPISWIVDYM